MNARSEDQDQYPDVFEEEESSKPTSTNVFPFSRSKKRRLKETKRDESRSSRKQSAGETPTPTSTTCPLESLHIGKELLNMEVALPIDAVFTLLFVQEQFMNDVLHAKKVTDITATSWQEREEDGVKFRQMTYTMPLPPSNLGPKVSYVTENQELQPQTVPGDVYVVECEVINGGIPYSETFTVIKHFCMTRRANGMTNVLIWVSIKYKKSPWGFVKTMIEKNTYSGVDIVFQEIQSQLLAEADKINKPGMGKKRRKGTNATGKGSSKAHASEQEQENKLAHSKADRSCLWFAIIIAIVGLVFGNVYIYNKLYHLEELAALEGHSGAIPQARYLGTEISWESVARILHKQQHLHEQQIDLWKSKINKAADSLKETQEALLWMLHKVQEYDSDLKLTVEEQNKIIKEQWILDSTRQEEQLHNVASQDFSPGSQSNITQNQSAGSNNV